MGPPGFPPVWGSGSPPGTPMRPLGASEAHGSPWGPWGPWVTLGAPWRPPSAPGPLPESILNGFWLLFGVHVGVLLAPISAHFLRIFLGTLLERLWDILAWIWEPFGVHFGSIFDAFWETL